MTQDTERATERDDGSDDYRAALQDSLGTWGHTPGPWTTTDPRGSGEDGFVYAAAPDLLEAAQAMLRATDSYHDQTGHDWPAAAMFGKCDPICDQRAGLRAAIARVEGRKP